MYVCKLGVPDNQYWLFLSRVTMFQKYRAYNIIESGDYKMNAEMLIILCTLYNQTKQLAQTSN